MTLARSRPHNLRAEAGGDPTRPALDAAPALAPWSLVYEHLRQPFPFLLDRCDGVSFAGSAPSAALVVDSHARVLRWARGVWNVERKEPIAAISSFVDEQRAQVASGWEPRADDPPLPRTVGYLAYELGALIERVPGPVRSLDVPLAVLLSYDRVDAWRADLARRATIRFRRGSHAAADGPTALPCAALAGLDDDDYDGYRDGYRRISAAIAAGEIYQANLSRRFSLPLPADAASVYRAMREHQPVPQGAYLDLGGFQILCNSPETFLRVEGDAVSTFPIKGTRPRGVSHIVDRRVAAELRASAKDLAEHLMIVDLERSDLGRVCTIGSVGVRRFAELMTLSTLHHLVSEIGGMLRPGCDLAELLRACFPGGSITGAPKIKAMEIIAETEGRTRGVYTGAIGCFNGSRSLDLNVAIRTAVSAHGRIHYTTGGGIVADSRLDQEYEETETKARAFREALATAGEEIP